MRSEQDEFRDMCAAFAMQVLCHGSDPGPAASKAFDYAEAMAAERKRRDTKRDAFGRAVG